MDSNPDVDEYVRRSRKWPDEIDRLRPVLLGCGLNEVIKWRAPCYLHEGRNIAIVQEMNDFLALMFFKGALLTDPEGILEEQGPNSRSARRVRFRSVDDVDRLAPSVTDLVADAVVAEREGRTVGPAPELVLADELQRRIDMDPEFAAAFRALTPGRQREYNIHVTGAARSSTRQARVDTHADRILAGKGLRDR